MAYAFNKEASYMIGGVYPATKDLYVRMSQRANIQVGSGAARFETTFPDILSPARYKLPRVKSDTIVDKWHTSPKSFWQNKVNFAAWCATAGCGVSVKDHLASSEPMIQSMYYFHVYYQMRRILEEMQVPLPQDPSFDAFDSPYNQMAYERICTEFNVSPHTVWRQKVSENSGLGTPYHWWKGRVRTIKEVSDDAVKNDIDPAFGVSSDVYRKDRMSFGDRPATFTVDYIDQGAEGGNAWTTFVLDKSDGFTQPGVERINDSIRTYVWTILGVQAQTRTSILGTDTAFDAQKQFLANVEDAISSPVDLPSAIARYQDVLRYAGSKVDFVFGIGLYMAPSDMELLAGGATIQNYNNEIVIAGPGQIMGMNGGINVAPLPASTYTGETGLVKAQTVADTTVPAAQPARPAVSAVEQAEGQAHSDGLTALVVGVVALGLGWLALRQ